MNTVRSLFSADGLAFPHHLSSREKERGKGLLERFVTLNGISVALLMDDLLILYAIRNGLSDPLVAVLASFIHLTMPLMIVGKLLISRIGLARTWALGWFLRYLCASLLIVAPLAGPAEAGVLRTALVLLGAFGFAAFRSIGAVSHTPLFGEVTSAEERGQFLYGTFVRGTATHFVALILVILIMTRIDGLWVYQVLLGIGTLVGFYASLQLAQIPESSSGRTSARAPILGKVSRMVRDRHMRRLIVGWCSGFTAFTLVIPFMVITLKNGYGTSDYTALSFSLLVLLGGIVSSLANGAISDRVGPRPLLVIYTAGIIGVALFWAVAPSAYLPVALGVSFFVAGLCKVGIIVGLGHYFLSSAGEDERVGGSLFLHMLGGAAAGLAGSVIGGGILQLLHGWGLTGLDPYRAYFRIALVLLIALFIGVYRLQRLRDWRVTSILGLLLSPRDLRALFVLSRLKRTDSSSDELQSVRRLSATGSALPEAELREYLESPNLSVRVRTLHALRNIPIGRETADAVIEELQRGYYTSAWVAAELLGEQGIRRAIPLLREGLESADHFLCGKCMQALVRLGDRESYSRIIEIFEATSNPRIAIYGANALSRLGGRRALEVILIKALETALPEPVIHEILTAAAASAGAGAEFYRFLREYRRDAAAAVDELMPTFPWHLPNENHHRGRVPSTAAEDDRPLHYLRLSLEGAAAAASGEQAKAVRTVLAQAQNRELPNKMAFCLALILSSSAPEAAHAYPLE